MTSSQTGPGSDLRRLVTAGAWWMIALLLIGLVDLFTQFSTNVALIRRPLVAAAAMTAAVLALQSQTAPATAPAGHVLRLALFGVVAAAFMRGREATS